MTPAPPKVLRTTRDDTVRRTVRGPLPTGGTPKTARLPERSDIRRPHDNHRRKPARRPRRRPSRLPNGWRLAGDVIDITPRAAQGARLPNPPVAVASLGDAVNTNRTPYAVPGPRHPDDMNPRSTWLEYTQGLLSRAQYIDTHHMTRFRSVVFALTSTAALALTVGVLGAFPATAGVDAGATVAEPTP